MVRNGDRSVNALRSDSSTTVVSALPATARAGGVLTAPALAASSPDDLAAMRGRKPRDLVYNYRDGVVALPVASVSNQLHMAVDDRAQSLLGIGYGLSRNNHLFIKLIQPKVHYSKEQIFFAGDMMIDARFRNSDGLGYVVHRGSVKSLFTNDLSCDPVDLSQSTGFSQSVRFRILF